MSVEENKRIARKYHDLNPDEVEEILTPDYIGRHPTGPLLTWNRDNHKPFLTNYPDMKDDIHEQIAEGEWVATRFTRSGTYQGRHFELHMMHFKRFKDGRIAELWEYFDSKQLEE